MQSPAQNEGRISLTMELIRGRPLRVGIRGTDIREAGMSLGMMHRDLHIRPSEGLPRAGSIYEPALRELPGLAPELRERTLVWLRGRRDDRLCHGAFYPGNVLVTRSEWRLISWRRAFAGDPLCDIARTLTRLGRYSRLRRWYLTGYFGKEPIPEEELQRWSCLNEVAELYASGHYNPLKSMILRRRLASIYQSPASG